MFLLRLCILQASSMRRFPCGYGFSSNKCWICETHRTCCNTDVLGMSHLALWIVVMLLMPLIFVHYWKPWCHMVLVPPHHSKDSKDVTIGDSFCQAGPIVIGCFNIIEVWDWHVRMMCGTILNFDLWVGLGPFRNNVKWLNFFLGHLDVIQNSFHLTFRISFVFSPRQPEYNEGNFVTLKECEMNNLHARHCNFSNGFDARGTHFSQTQDLPWFWKT